MQTKIGIIGQGYVGLPLALAATKAGYLVLGYDNNVEKIDLINQAVSPIGDIANADLQVVIKSGRYRATSQIKELDSLDVILICVPTPLTDGHKPDLSNLESALKSIAEFLSEGTLVIIESTIAYKLFPRCPIYPHNRTICIYKYVKIQFYCIYIHS